MSKKIEGWEYQGGEWSTYNEISFYRHFVGKEEEPSEAPATLVVHDGDKHERVFTESEVKAMALAAIKSIQKVLPQSPGHVGVAGGEIAKALLDVGIILDPA